ESLELCVELCGSCPIDGVAAMRTVDGNDGHRAFAFDQHVVGLGHVRRPPFGCYEASLTLSNFSMPSRTKATRMVGSPIASWASSKQTFLVMTYSGWKCPAATCTSHHSIVLPPPQVSCRMSPSSASGGGEGSRRVEKFPQETLEPDRILDLGEMSG